MKNLNSDRIRNYLSQNGQKIVCTICARGGSQGVKNKNIREFCGQPLILWTVRQALQAGIFDVVAVSSDSDEILSAAKAAGAHILIKRPEELATHQSGKLPAIQHALEYIENQKQKKFDFLCDLDCTSPLRNVEDILQAFMLLLEKNAANVITAMPSRRSPYFNLIEKQAGYGWRPSKWQNGVVFRRQDAPETYDMNASIYIWKRDSLLKSDSVFTPETEMFLMPEDRSLDIDTETDFRIVEFLAKTRNDFQT